MATTLYLKSSLAQISRGTNTNGQGGSALSWRSYALSTTVGTGAGTALSVASAAGPVAGLEFPPTTGIYAEWISEPLAAAVTISGTVSYRFCGAESSTMANGSASFRVDRLDSTGAIASTVATASHGTELSSSAGLSPSAHAFTATPTSTAFLKGDRIRIVAFVDDNATTTNMASGYTFGLTVDGAAASTADTYVQFTENLTWGSTSPKEVKLRASDKAQGDFFGNAVACSPNGSVLVVGSYRDSGGGSAYVYTGTNYGTEKRLAASDRVTNDNFGNAVACSSDGSVVVVGAPQATTGGVSMAGAAYIYSGAGLATETKLTSPDTYAYGDKFGNSVACSSDGSVVFVGCPDANSGSNNAAGAIYVYSGSNWGTVTKLTASDTSTTGGLGVSLACSTDGSVVVGGAWSADVGASLNTGAAYVFSGTNYATEKKLYASDRAQGDEIGNAVACSSDGSVVVVGGYLTSPGGTSFAGDAYVFYGTNYATEKKLVASDKAANDNFGFSVACLGDGSVVYVGSYKADVSGLTDAGAVYVYSGSNYGTETKLTASDKVSGDWFGSSVCCSSDGSVVAIGASSTQDFNNVQVGTAYTYLARRYYLTTTTSDIADQGTDERKVWTTR